MSKRTKTTNGAIVRPPGRPPSPATRGDLHTPTARAIRSEPSTTISKTSTSSSTEDGTYQRFLDRRLHDEDAVEGQSGRRRIWRCRPDDSRICSSGITRNTYVGDKKLVTISKSLGVVLQPLWDGVAQGTRPHDRQGNRREQRRGREFRRKLARPRAPPACHLSGVDLARSFRTINPEMSAAGAAPCGLRYRRRDGVTLEPAIVDEHGTTSLRGNRRMALAKEARHRTHHRDDNVLAMVRRLINSGCIAAIGLQHRQERDGARRSRKRLAALFYEAGA